MTNITEELLNLRNEQFMAQSTKTITAPGPQICNYCQNMIYSYPQWFHEPCSGGVGLGHDVPDWTRLLAGKVCPECLLPKPEDDRVAEGQKCMACAGYGTEER